MVNKYFPKRNSSLTQDARSFSKSIAQNLTKAKPNISLKSHPTRYRAALESVIDSQTKIPYSYGVRVFSIVRCISVVHYA